MPIFDVDQPRTAPIPMPVYNPVAGAPPAPPPAYVPMPGTYGPGFPGNFDPPRSLPTPVQAPPGYTPIPAFPGEQPGTPGAYGPAGHMSDVQAQMNQRQAMAAATSAMNGSAQVSPAMQQIMQAARMGALHAQMGRQPAVRPPVRRPGAPAVQTPQQMMALRELFARLRGGA